MPEPVASAADGGRYRIGVFELDPGTLELRKNGRSVRVRPQSLKLLTLLLSRAGELVSRADIEKALWDRETFVDFEQGVNHCIKELRTAFGDAPESPRYIQTLPRRGYVFIGPVERLPASPAQAAGDGGALSRRRLGPIWLQAIGLAVALAGVLIILYAARPGGTAKPQAAALTVLPFSTRQADPALGVGLANAISTRLGGQQLMSIRPMGGGPGPAGDGAVSLEGDISASGADLTVVAHLKGATGATLWSERFRARADELFSVENVIAERVVAALNLQLAAAEQDRLLRRYTSNTAAYEEYIRGRAALVTYTPEGTLRAVEAFERALHRDADYALARAGLAMASADMYLRFASAGDVERWGERAEAAARAALDQDPDLAEAHLARAAVARKREFDWNATMATSRRALVLNPNLDQAHFFMAAAYYHLGFMEEALIEMEKGRSLRGVDVIEPVRIEALVALFSGNFVPARVHLEALSQRSSQAIGDTYLALAYYYTGSVERGRTMLESLATQASASTATRSGAALAGILAAEGKTASARQHLNDVLARDYRDHHVAYSIGVAYAQLGDSHDAVRWLRTAADTGFPCVTWFERDPLLERIRRLPQFSEMVAYVRTRRDSSLSRVD
ncbi:MAG TPA: winged helix-turn-helix domain-containing protein [Vicinamibacterales bacterium]|nr:winged helix-turn-helix domain-containing protein [Vicinamibacterales bacterium]